jgi:hypothetical protein
MDLEAQRDQLQTLAKAQRINLAPVNKLHDDPRLKIFAIATLLGIDPMAPLRGDVPIKRLVSQARKQERAQAQYIRQELTLLGELGVASKIIKQLGRSA